MFKSLGSMVGFLIGVVLTVGLLLTPHLLPWGYRIGLQWTVIQIALAALAGLAVLALTLWIAGRLIQGAKSWKEPKVIGGVILIAVVANFLYGFLVEFFALTGGWRAFIALLGVPVIYGNLTAVLGKIKLREAMLSIFNSALATMGAGFIIAAMIRGW